MTVIKARLQRNTYFDSISLMKIARLLTAMDGVEDAAAIMATEPNLQLLAEAGLAPFEIEGNASITPTPADILFVVRASDEHVAQAALQAGQEQLTQRPTTTSNTDTIGTVNPPQHRSLEQAVRLHPEAKLATISVPGPYAALEAEQALRAGLHVFLFSDNVPLADEIALKTLAHERGLLVMGPDCGTAMFNGAGLGFINVVPRGPIGIVGASGTGIQQVMSLIAQHKSGVSQVIGCGGRDLTEAVGAITTLQGLRLLQEDEQTKVIVLISKPPAPSVAERVLATATAISHTKPVVAIFVGADHDTLQSRYGERIIITRTLAEAAEKAIQCLGGVTIDLGDHKGHPYHETKQPEEDIRRGRARLGPGFGHKTDPLQSPGFLSALFSGGTLCDEAMHIWAARLGPIYSNIPLKPEWQLREGQVGHRAIDFGADEYTRGRPHPMIDPSLRLKRLQEEARNPDVGVILLDIVLGYCSHPDPASVYAPAIRAAREQAQRAGRSLTCIISLCGTEDDPQRLSLQAQQLRDVGAEVFTSNAEAALRCVGA
jgi:FdrA protein